MYRMLFAAVIALSGAPLANAQTPEAIDYRVLATSKTSTMEKELNEAAEAGFRFGAVMGGETAFGGNEVAVVMTKSAGAGGRYAYKLLATSRTSTMQRELQEAADAGFEYRGQTVFQSLFGGEEVVVILERDAEADRQAFEYRLIATSRTSTLQKELTAAGADGFEIVGMTVGKTALGGKEIVVITRRARR
ncbi:MAG: hypothetical protein AB1635_11275 [Acidobacteriota bacterium]